MSSAIEVLKDRVETIKLVHKEILDETKWRDFLGEDITPERRDAINKRINALGEAVLALEQKENYVIDFIKLEVLPKNKKEQFRVFFKDGTEQVFEKERVGEQK